MKKLKAIVLIETLFLVALIGFISSFAIWFYKRQSYAENIALTKFKANYIRKVIEGYVATHGFLPYAAKDLNGEESDDECIGYLPYITLGISKYYAYDAFGKPFKFVVNRNLVLNHYKKDGWRILPPFIPFMLASSFSKHWNRLNMFYSSTHKKFLKPEFHRPAFLYDYDDIDSNFNIYIYHKNKKLQLTYVDPYPIIKNNQIDMVLNKLQPIKEYRIHDIVAWVLLSMKKSEDISLHIYSEKYRLVFWQSRFNLAAIIRNPMTICMSLIGTSKIAIAKQRI